VGTLQEEMRGGMISNYSSGLGGLGHWLHWAFDLRPVGTDGELRAGFEAFLVDEYDKGRRCLLMVDEAQNVGDDDIAVLADLTRLPSVQGPSMLLVLVGQPRLRPRLPASPGSVDPDGSVTFQIGPMSAEDTSGYIHHRLAISGCSHPVFDDETVARIAQLTGGVPRLVNVLCELLLTSAFGAGERQIGTALLDTVLRDVHETGMLDHLLAKSNQPIVRSSAPQPTCAMCLPTTPASVSGQFPVTNPPDPDTARVANTSVENATNELPCLPTSPVRMTRQASSRHEFATLPVIAGWTARSMRRVGLTLVTVGAAAATVALALLANQSSHFPNETPARDLSILHQDSIPANSTPAEPTQDMVGPAIPAPANLQDADAATLRDQAVTIGAQDPLVAVIGFARAALRGDARAAYYLGQHFEAGDGVPPNSKLAAAWYATAAKTQRSARRALQNLAGTHDTTVLIPTAPPRPLMGLVGTDGLAEFVWAAPDEAAARYLIEMAETTTTEPRQYGPFDLSAALIENAPPARLWRVVALGPGNERVRASNWHLIELKASEAIARRN
jgi:hypothetical protein